MAFARIGAPSKITFIYDCFFLRRGKNSSGQGFAHGPFHTSGGGGGCQQGLDGISHAGTLQLSASALPFGGCDLKMAGATSGCVICTVAVISPEDQPMDFGGPIGPLGN